MFIITANDYNRAINNNKGIYRYNNLNNNSVYYKRFYRESEIFNSQHEIDTFLKEPRLAMLIYPGSRPAPTGVPVWFDWDGKMVRIFTSRTSPKVRQLTKNPNISVLVTNRVGEPEGWVAFDGKVAIKDFSAADWSNFLNRVAPRYWDLTDPAYAKQIEGWQAVPEAFVTLELEPEVVRSGA